MAMMCRLLNPDDLQAVRALRREALESDPDAFLATVEMDQSTTDEDWHKRLTADHDQFLVGAFINGELIGMIGARRLGWAKTKHTADVWGTYVSPRARGSGACKAMLEMQIAHARSLHDLVCLKLGVIDGNAAALRAYESVGYKTFATEPLFMRVQDGTLASQHMMMYEL